MINKWEILLEKGQTYYELENYEKASETFKKVLSEKPDLVSAMKNLAECYEHLGNKKDAITSFEKLLAYEPTNTELMSKIGGLYIDIVQPEKAINYYDKAASLQRLSTCMDILRLRRRLPTRFRGRRISRMRILHRIT